MATTRGRGPRKKTAAEPSSKKRPIEQYDHRDKMATETATLAELAPIVEGKPDVTRLSSIDLLELAKRFRFQKIVFEAAADIFDQTKHGWSGSREALLGQIVGLVEAFIASDRIRMFPESFMEEPLRRRLLLTLNMNRLVRHIWQAIRFENTLALRPVFDSERPIRSTGDMLPWFTGRPWEYTRKDPRGVSPCGCARAASRPAAGGS